MTEGNPLLDGALSVKVAGVEYAAHAGALQYETVAPGGFGPASFEVYPDDPFTVPAAYPELANEAEVIVRHGAVILYEGSIVGDPTIAKLANGESLIAVECGGLLDKAKYRQDYGATAVDTTYDNWARHRVSDKGIADTIDGMLRFDVNDGQIFTSGDIAGIFYRVNQGIVTSPDDEVFALDFEYDLAMAAVNWHCDIWAAPYYVDSLDSAAWTTGLWAQSNTTAAGTAHVTGFPAGTRCIAFVSWVSWSGTSGAKRHAEITDLRVNCFDAASAAPTVDEAMVDCGVVTGLATASDTETIGNPLEQCMIPPSTTHADGLDKFASMYEAPVDWGFWDNATLRVRKRLNSPADDVAIRALAGAGTAPAAYLLDATTPAFDYDVHKYEEGKFDYVRAVFTSSHGDPSDQFAGGMLRTVCAPSEPPADADVKVGILDLTGRGDLTVDRAFAVATQALAWIDSTLETGTIEVFSPTVPIYGGGTKLAAYMRASDWTECLQVSAAAEALLAGSSRPLWISSSHVDVDGGVTTLTIEPYPFDVAESDFGHAHMSRLRRWKKARRGMYRRQKAALRKAQAKEYRTKLGPGHKRRIHYI